MTALIRLFSAPSDTTPDTFTFPSKTGTARGVYVASDPVTPTGYNAAASVTVSGGQYSFDGTTWYSDPGTIAPGSKIYLRQVTSTDFLAATTVTVSVGGVLAGFTCTTEAMDSIPDSFYFDTVIHQEINTVIESNTVVPTGYTASISVSASNGALVSKNNGVSWSSTVTLIPGDSLKVKFTTPSSFASFTNISIFSGATVFANWWVRTRNGFANVTGVALNTLVTSEQLTPYLPNGSTVQVTIDNGGSISTRTNSTTWRTTEWIRVGYDYMYVRGISNTSTYAQSKIFTITFASNPTVYWSVTTRDPDNTPTPFTITSNTNVNRNTVVTSASFTPTGYEQANVSVDNGGTLLIAGSVVGSSGVIKSGQSLAVRGISSSNALTSTVYTVTFGTYQTTWTTTTRDWDRAPTAFSFTAVTGATQNSTYTSNTITPTGYETAVSVTITAGGSFSINSGAWVTSGTMSPGDTIALRQTSSPYPGTGTSVTVTIGTTSSTWTVTTGGDGTPNAFSFTSNLGVIRDTTVDSNLVTLTGFSAPVLASVTSGLMSINGGAFTSTSTPVYLNDTLKLRTTASSQYDTYSNVSVTVGSTTQTWVVRSEQVAFGSTSYNITGSYSFTVPENVYSVGIAVVGAGANGVAGYGTSGGSQGGGGGGFAWRNIAVTPGETLSVYVGQYGSTGGSSYVSRGGTILLQGSGGSGSSGGSFTTSGDGGGGTGGGGYYGTASYAGGGGGAGGYLGNGGYGGGSGSGGAGGAGQNGFGGGGGGGTGLTGYTTNGAGGGTSYSVSGGSYGRGGSGGGNGMSGNYGNGGTGGGPGAGGGGGKGSSGSAGDGAAGRVRIIWGGDKSFPYNAV